MNNKILLVSQTKGGFKRYTFCPNRKVAELAHEYIESKGGKLLSLRNYSDTKFLETKIRVRTDEFVDAVETYHMVKSLTTMDKAIKSTVLNTLLNSIEGHISALTGLLRRVEVKGYKIDNLEYTKEVIDLWLEEEDY